MARMNKIDGEKGWSFSTTYTTPGAQEVVNLPYQPSGYSIQLTPTGGTAKWQASNDNINWIDWDEDLVSISTATYMCPMRYGRVVHGTCTSSDIAIWGQE